MPIAKANGLELYYEDEGDGLPLIMIMGLSAQHSWWSPALVEALKGQGFRVIRFDNRDIGASTRLEHLGRPNVRRLTARALVGLKVRPPYLLEDLADDTVGLMDALGIERAHIVGASMGGMVAQRIALNHARRVASLTLMFTSSTSRADGLPTPRAMRMLLMPPPQTREETVDAFVIVGRTLMGKGYPFNETYWRDLGATCFDHSIGPPGTARQLAAVMGSGTTIHRLRAIKVPTLVVHGMQDILVRPRGGVRLARRIPRARLLMLGGVGHHLPRALHQTVAANIRAVAAAAK